MQKGQFHGSPQGWSGEVAAVVIEVEAVDGSGGICQLAGELHSQPANYSPIINRNAGSLRLMMAMSEARPIDL